MKQGSGQEKLTQIIFQFISDNFKLVAFVVIPFQAFSAKFLFFRESGLNYIEHTVLPFYVQGHVQWINIINAIIFKLSGIFINGFIMSFISTFYFCYAYSNFIDYQPKWKSILKGLGIFYISLTIFILIVMIVLSLLVKFNPDIYNLLKPSNNK